MLFEPSGIQGERLLAECLKVCNIVKYVNDRIEVTHEVVATAEGPIEMRAHKGVGLAFAPTRAARRRGQPASPHRAVTLRSVATTGPPQSCFTA